MRFFSLGVQLAAFLLLGCHASGGDRAGGTSGSFPRPASPAKNPNGAFAEASRDSVAPDPASRAAATKMKPGPEAGSIKANTDQAAVSISTPFYSAPNFNPAVPGYSAYGDSNRRPLANTFIDTVNALRGDGLPLNSPSKATDPTILFRVRGNDAMLLWRYRF